MVGSLLQNSSPREKDKKGENYHKACMGTLSYGSCPPIYRHFDVGYFRNLDMQEDNDVSIEI